MLCRPGCRRGVAVCGKVGFLHLASAGNDILAIPKLCSGSLVARLVKDAAIHHGSSAGDGALLCAGLGGRALARLIATGVAWPGSASGLAAAASLVRDMLAPASGCGVSPLVLRCPWSSTDIPRAVARSVLAPKLRSASDAEAIDDIAAAAVEAVTCCARAGGARAVSVRVERGAEWLRATGATGDTAPPSGAWCEPGTLVIDTPQPSAVVRRAWGGGGGRCAALVESLTTPVTDLTLVAAATGGGVRSGDDGREGGSAKGRADGREGSAALMPGSGPGRPEPGSSGGPPPASSPTGPRPSRPAAAAHEERRRLEELASRLRAAGVTVLLVQKLVPPHAEEAMWRHGVLPLRQLSRRHFAAACALAGCAPLSDWRSLVALGREEAAEALEACCGELKDVSFGPGGRTCLRGGGPSPAAVCLASSSPVQQAAASQAIDALRLVLSEPAVVPGAGMAEAGMARAMRAAAHTLLSGDARQRAASVCLGAVADALSDVVVALGCDVVPCGGRCNTAPPSEGVQCGSCACAEWGRRWALREAAPAAVPASVTRFAAQDGSCDGAVTVVHGATIAEAGGLARRLLPSGSRVLPLSRPGALAWEAIVLPAATLDPVVTVRNAISRALEAVGMALRVDAELISPAMARASAGPDV